jgi:hypothetical protein
MNFMSDLILTLEEYNIVNDCGRRLVLCILWFIHYFVKEILNLRHLSISSLLQPRPSMRNACKRFAPVVGRWIWREGFAGQLQ